MTDGGSGVTYPLTALVAGSGPGISYRVHSASELDVLSSLCGPVTVLVGAESCVFTTTVAAIPGLYISVDGSAWMRVCCDHVVPLPSGYTQLRVGVVRGAGQRLVHDVLVSASRDEHDPAKDYFDKHVYMFDPTEGGRWRRCVVAAGPWRELVSSRGELGTWVSRSLVSVIHNTVLSHARIGVDGFRGVNTASANVTLGLPGSVGSLGFVEFDCADVDELDDTGRAQLLEMFTRMWETYAFQAVHICGVRVRDLDLLATCTATAVIITFREDDVAADADPDIWPAAVLSEEGALVRPMPTDARVFFFPLPCVAELSLRNAPSRVLPLLAPVAQLFRVLEVKQLHAVESLAFNQAVPDTVWSNLSLLKASLATLSFPPATAFRKHFPVLREVDVTVGKTVGTLDTLTSLAALSGMNVSIHAANRDWAKDNLKELITRIRANGNFVDYDTLCLAGLPIPDNHERSRILAVESGLRERFTTEMVAMIHSAVSKAVGTPAQTPSVVHDATAAATEMTAAFISAVEEQAKAAQREDEPRKYWPMFWGIDANAGVARFAEDIPPEWGPRCGPAEDRPIEAVTEVVVEPLGDENWSPTGWGHPTGDEEEEEEGGEGDHPVDLDDGRFQDTAAGHVAVEESSSDDDDYSPGSGQPASLVADHPDLDTGDNAYTGDDRSTPIDPPAEEEETDHDRVLRELDEILDE